MTSKTLLALALVAPLALMAAASGDDVAKKRAQIAIQHKLDKLYEMSRAQAALKREIVAKRSKLDNGVTADELRDLREKEVSNEVDMQKLANEAHVLCTENNRNHLHYRDFGAYQIMSWGSYVESVRERQLEAQEYRAKIVPEEKIPAGAGARSVRDQNSFYAQMANTHEHSARLLDIDLNATLRKVKSGCGL